MLLAAFTATHLPPPTKPFPPLVHDKWLHAIGFAGLGFFTLWRLATTKKAIPARVLGLWCLALLAYGAFDEITQPLAGRSCEFSDWLADGTGAAIGSVIVFLWHRRAIRTSAGS